MINVMGMNMTTSMTYYYEAVRASIIYLWDWFFYEILTFCTFSIIRNHAALGELIKLYTNSTSIIKITTASVISFGIIQCLRFIISLRSESSSSAGFSMKPMLFPSQTFHTRFFPEKHSFKYSYLLVGIPIGWKGSIGGILSVDTGKEISPWYRRLLSMKTGGAWYTVNGDDYLERGHVEGGLRGKLDAYLISQNESPIGYPHAYLLTAARFLNYSSNPVSIWNLYSQYQTLTAVILEVNNTFDERHMYFLKPSSPSILPSENPSQETHQTETLSEKFTQSFPKQFYVSPLNSRSGSYTLSTHDPFSSTLSATKYGLLNTTITLLSSTSSPKLVARLSSSAPPLDPASMSLISKIIFLGKYWWVGLATFPRTVKEAFNLLVRRRLPWVTRPEPKASTIARRADGYEVLIAGLFVDWLRDVVERCEKAVVVRYIPCGLSTYEEESMISPAAQMSNEVERTGMEIKIKILSPSFYAAFPSYVSSVDGMLVEMSKETIVISEPKQFREVAAVFKGSSRGDQLGLYETLRWKAINLLKPKQRSDFETFIYHHAQPGVRRKYVGRVLKERISEYIAFGSVELLDLEIFIFKSIGIWVLAGYVWV